MSAGGVASRPVEGSAIKNTVVVKAPPASEGS
jgi:hypothetical protein